ncbi:phage baseplate assembly protein V [Halopseudomonas litoralis]|uniref:Phage baseplate assembly protein V n=1 Tax=Halopseudomonas litoralis TaxID=797277 RepID=A0A1H1SR19_9GAMM|nr:phage baseplate assembly protein V [Halopseudomonas litoralis]SDS49829.1 phage baseplate assembly protein V [Halopseudomonas litoralis]
MNPIADLRRRLDNMIRPGTIYAVDHAQTRCRVKTGDLLTGWLRYFVGRAGSVRRHSAPSLGEQCTVFSPSGEMATGFVLVGINSDQFPAPSVSPSLDSTTYADGTWFGYDMGSKEMTVIMTTGGKITAYAPGGVAIHGDVTITGTVTVSEDVAVKGSVKADKDVVASGVDLVTHTHGGVERGSSRTEAPQ